MKIALCILALLTLGQSQDAPPARFVGTWVGFQTWAIENPPPNARTPQPVEIDIQLVDGKLIGMLTPFFGGSDGASFAESHIVGDDLQASGAMGQPAQKRPPAGWKTTVRIEFDFKATADKNQLVGTADVMMGDVKWTKFKFELSRKRSRY